MTTKKTVLVVGASRGLGLALAEEYCGRGWQVIATSRGQSSGLKQLQERYPETIEIETVDVVDLRSVKALHSRLEDRKLDVLFVNAGICKATEFTPVEVEEKDFLDMMLTNA
jgi:NAD(P)-dependent dehydrogenase (short-subunit alcohol dehydrogenase family)